MPLSVEEVKAHPGSKDVINLPQPASSGLAEVGKGRSCGLFKIAWEIYGQGPIHTVWIMGLNAPKIVWHRQCRYFGVEQGDTYSVLIFDNRGAGNSDKPLTRYSTSEMAKDLFELLEQIGWGLPRRNHLVGVSMGGMIAMEFALLAPELVVSLTLQSTAASLKSTMPWYENLINRTKMIMPKSYAARVANIQRMCFSKKWLEAPDEQGVFPTNADRQTAEDLYRVEHLPPPVYAAFILQALAASGHKVSTGRLQELASKVGKKEEKTGMAPILVCTGTADLTIEYKHSEEIVEGLGGEESGKVILKKFEGAGHVLSWECQKEYNQMLQEHFLAATERME